MRPHSGLVRSGGGVLIANIGVGSDELEEDIETLITEIQAQVAEPQPRVLLSDGAGTLSSLFAPSNPPIRPQAGLLVWALHPSALTGAVHGPQIWQRLSGFFQQLRLTQIVVLPEAASPAAQAIAAMIADHRIPIRLVASDQSFLAEVYRPEGVVIVALVGSPYTPVKLPTDKTIWLPAPVQRAPQLNRRLLALADADTESNRNALYETLLTRPFPLLFLVDPQTRTARFRRWPGGVTALPVYPDEQSALTMASDLSLPPEALAFGQLIPLALFRWAAGEGFGVAMNVFRTPEEPIYVSVDPRALLAFYERKSAQD